MRRLGIVAVGLVAAIAAGVVATTSTHADARYQSEVFASATVTSNVVYGQAPDEYGQPVTLLLDLYQPTDDTIPGRPALVWIHGGGFTGGSKSDETAVTVANRFARRGYVVISIDYRTRPGNYFEQGDTGLASAVLDAQHDAQASVRWLRANASTYRMDSSRIAVGGTSAGAITALQVAYNSGDPGDSGNPGYASTVSAVVDVSGATATSLIDAGEPPVLIVHGAIDERVAFDNALDIVARAEEVGVPCEFHPLEDAGHGLWKAGHTEPIIGWMSDFLYAWVAPSVVSGIAELPAAADSSAEQAGTPAEGSGWSAGHYAALASGLAAPLVVIVAGAWYARRRRLR